MLVFSAYLLKLFYLLQLYEIHKYVKKYVVKVFTTFFFYGQSNSSRAMLQV